MSEVYKAIAAIQGELAKTGISKDRTNQTPGANYKFRGIDDVYNALSPLLAKHGLCILPRMLSREVVERRSAKGNALFYVTVDAEFDFVSSSDASKHTVRTFGEAMDSGDKATNKAMSAAYKYAAFQAFAIPTEGDNDADDTTHEVVGTQKPQDQAQRQKIARITPDQEIMLEDKMREAGVDPAKFLAPSDVTRAADLPVSHFAAAMKSLNDRIAKSQARNPQRSEALDDEIPY